MSFSLTLKIESVPPPLNVFLRMHYHKRNQLGRSITNQIHFLSKGKVPAEPLRKALIEIERHNWRFCDFDGAVGSYKNHIDSLIKNNIIVDDSWAVVGAWKLDQIFRPKRLGPLTVIKVTEIE